MGRQITPEHVLLVHLTDFHVKSVSSEAYTRLKKMSGPIGALIEAPTEIILVLSGDIAFSGQADQYKIVSEELSTLKSQLREWAVTNIHVVTSPGNHDCNFGAMPEAVRDALLASQDLDGQKPLEIVNALAPIQAEYFNFSNHEANGQFIQRNRAVSEYLVELLGFKLKILSLNTAWSSRNPEKVGTLRMPAHLLPSVSKDADLCIAVAHHPLNWFTPRDAVCLSEWLDSTVDIVFFGHEHRLDEYRQIRSRIGSSVDYQIGLPMEDRNELCGFKCLRIDLEQKTVTAFDVVFSDGATKTNEVYSSDLHHNQGRDRGVVRFSKNHIDFLEDPGAGFSHPRINRAIVLSDLFVPPEFREFQSEKIGGEKIDGNSSFSEVCNAIALNEKCFVVFGSEASGKTTFAKNLILNSRSHRLIPLYLDGQGLKSLNKGEIRGWINAAISSQYESDSVDQISKSDPGKLVVIIDNVHSIPGGNDGVELVRDILNAKSRRIVFLTSDNPAVSIITAGQMGDEVAYWKGTDAYELLPLGHKRRGELIRRWVALGRDSIEDSIAIEAEVRQVKGLLDRVLGKNPPKYPLFILVLLQQLEGMRGNRTAVANGSHGYLFEALISQSIDKYVRSHEISTVNDFLAAIAYSIWKRDGEALSQSAIDDIISGFLLKLVSIDGGKLLKELDDARVILSDCGVFRFRYQYLYYYYLAKWICANKAEEESNRLIDKMISLIHTEQSSNVLMFVAHMEEEQLVISKLLPLLDGLFSSNEPCALENYSGLFSRFRTSKQRAVLFHGSAKDVSDQHNKVLDDVDGAVSESKESVQAAEDSLKFNTTLKAIHTLGQVLKSRATSISPEQKIEIAKSAMLSGRRLMAFLYALTEENAESIVHSFSDAFEKAFELNREQAVRIANSLIGAIVGGIATTCVSRVADALGSAELRPLLDRLSSDMDDADSRLILLVARIVGGKVYPKEIVEDYVRALKPANVLPVGVLASTVARRFYLDPPERSIRDSACKLLGIDVKPIPGRKNQLPKSA